MPRVLFVTYPWLPAFNGSVRHVATLCRYLPEAGWDPIVLCKDFSEGTDLVDAPLGLTFEGTDDVPALRSAKSIPVTHAAFAPRDNRLMRWRASLAASSADGYVGRVRQLAKAALNVTYPLYGNYPDEFRGWVPDAVRAGVGAVRQFGIGAVVSVSSPDSAHVAGGEIARASGIPWIPLFGELGSFDPRPDEGASVWQRMERRELARRWMRGASAVGAVSPAMLAQLLHLYGVSGETLIVPFDPDERRVPPRRTPGSPLKLVHVGRIDPAVQRVDLLFDALDLLLAEDAALAESMQVDLVGSGCDDLLRERVAERPSGKVCRIVPRVKPADAVIAQREADVLLLFDRADALSRYPATFSERLNARRPIITVGTAGGFMGGVLEATRAGELGEDAPAIAMLIKRSLDELGVAGEVSFRGDDAAIARHGGPEQARRLAKMLDVASAERFGTWQRG